MWYVRTPEVDLEGAGGGERAGHGVEHEHAHQHQALVLRGLNMRFGDDKDHDDEVSEDEITSEEEEEEEENPVWCYWSCSGLCVCEHTRTCFSQSGSSAYPIHDAS